MSGANVEKYSIISLWAAEKLPARDGLYLADGRSFHFRIECFPDPAIFPGDEFDLTHLLRGDPLILTEYDITFVLPLVGGGRICGGEASHGSEGFFAFLNPAGDLVWVMYNEESNPYVKAVEDSDGKIKITSSAGFELMVDLNDPLSTHLIAG